MKKIYAKFFDLLEIGDDFPTTIMGVINLSPESFYKGSVFNDLTHIKRVALEMIKNGAHIIDLGARSTAPWSKKITIEEEVEIIISLLPSMSKSLISGAPTGSDIALIPVVS